MATAAKPKVKSSDFDDAPARDATLFLLDGSSLAYRSFFALPQEIATADGRTTNALLGFANMLVKLISDFSPQAVVVAWDLGGVTKRKAAFADYKAQRPPMPDLLSEQWPHFKPLVEAFGYTNVSLQEYEADDVIGTLAAEASGKGIKTCIVTSDRDAMQLVDERTVVMSNTKGISEVAVYTPERVQLRFGVTPKQIPDLISLRGDTSDNIPGVPGIGEKTAADLLQEFGSLENVLANIDRVGGTKRKELLREHADNALLSKELATIVCDLPLEIDLDAVHTSTPDRSRLLEMCQTFEFRSLARRITDLELDTPSPGVSAAPGQGSLTDGPTPPPAAATGELLAARLVSPLELRSTLAAASPGRALPLVVTADGETVTAACLVEEGVPDGGTVTRWVAVMRGSVGSIAEALAGQRVTTFDFKGLPPRVRDGLTLADDVLIESYLLQPGRRTYLLGEIISELGLSVRLTFAEDDSTLVEVARQAALIEHADRISRERIEAQGMAALLDDIELPLVTVLAEMERVGIRIDSYRMGEIAHKVADQLEELRDRAYSLAGGEFNLGSPSQLATVLFENLGLPSGRKGKTGYSTDARVLRDLRDMHPIISVIEQHRELSKLQGTYLEALPVLVDRVSGRIHTTFSQTSAATGRLSSVNPNLQNIPVRTPVGREIRSAFVPAEGHVFVACDYSQVELRLLAHVSGEPKLIEIFERGDDIHLATAAEIAGIAPADVTRELRNAAKAVNFGIIYGISSFGLSANLQISREEAQQYIDRYLGRYPHVSDFMERTIEVARNQGYVETLFGRRRPIPELKSRSFQTRQLGERLAVNTVLQGTAADVIKIAMVRTHDRLAALPRAEGEVTRVVLQIHDELLMEAPVARAREIGQVAREEMVAAFPTQPPLVVDIGVGPTWLDAK